MLRRIDLLFDVVMPAFASIIMLSFLVLLWTLVWGISTGKIEDTRKTRINLEIPCNGVISK